MPTSSDTSHSPYLIGHVHYHGVANTMAILNSQGQCISDDVIYGDINFLSDKWTMGVRYEPVTEEPSDGSEYRIVAADLYYMDSLVATITSAEYKSGLTVHGDYIYLRNPHDVINRNGARTAVTDPQGFYYIGTSEFNLHHDAEGHHMHWGSGQFAFTEGCTLVADEVVHSVLFDGAGNFIDLQGNILFHTDLLPNNYAEKIQVYNDQYVIINNRADSLYYMFNLQGDLLASGSAFGDMYNWSNGVMSAGYQLYADAEGYLHYVDASGQEPCTFTVHRDDVESASLTHNLPFIFYHDATTGKYAIITAAAGVLPMQYDAIAGYKYNAYSPGAPLLGVILNGKTGVIDLYGNTIIDFQYKNIQMNHNGTLVALNSGSMTTTDVYRIDYTDPAAEEAAHLEAEAEAARLAAEEAARLEAEAAAEAERLAAEQAAAAIWHCDACDRDNDMNFCPSCGQARPVLPPVCSSCGYEAPDASYRFCPSCGQAF